MGTCLGGAPPALTGTALERTRRTLGRARSLHHKTTKDPSQEEGCGQLPGGQSPVPRGQTSLRPGCSCVLGRALPLSLKGVLPHHGLAQRLRVPPRTQPARKVTVPPLSAGGNTGASGLHVACCTSRTPDIPPPTWCPQPPNSSQQPVTAPSREAVFLLCCGGSGPGALASLVVVDRWIVDHASPRPRGTWRKLVGRGAVTDPSPNLCRLCWS